MFMWPPCMTVIACLAANLSILQPIEIVWTSCMHETHFQSTCDTPLRRAVSNPSTAKQDCEWTRVNLSGSELCMNCAVIICDMCLLLKKLWYQDCAKSKNFFLLVTFLYLLPPPFKDTVFLLHSLFHLFFWPIAPACEAVLSFVCWPLLSSRVVTRG